MKKIKKLRYCMIAAGLILSAAFYTLSSAEGEGGLTAQPGRLWKTREDTVWLDTGQREAYGSAMSEDASGSESLTELNTQEAGLQQAGSGNGSGRQKANDDSGVPCITEEDRTELTSLVREAVREELTAMSEAGYLDKALSEAAAAAEREALRKAGLVNINTAGVSELMSLEGIGAKRAQDIISDREINGSFKTASDIMRVNGIKESLYEKIKDKICI